MLWVSPFVCIHFFHDDDSDDDDDDKDPSERERQQKRVYKRKSLLEVTTITIINSLFSNPP